MIMALDMDAVMIMMIMMIVIRMMIRMKIRDADTKNGIVIL